MKGDIFIDDGGILVYLGVCERVNDFTDRAYLQVLKKPFYPVTMLSNMNIDRVIFNDPATIVLWKDGTKTIVKCQKGDKYSKEVGLAMCICKKAYGNTGAYNEIFKEYVPEEPKVEVREVVLTGKLRKLSPEEEGKIRKEYGMDETARKPGRKRVDVGKIRALSHAGWKPSEIADDMGVSVQTVKKYL